MTFIQEQPRTTKFDKKKRGQAVRLYNSLEKQFLHQSEAEKLSKTRKSFEPGNSSYHNSVAGWMLAELAIINTDLEIEDRLELLNEARGDWNRALEIESEKQSTKEINKHFLLSPSEIRLRSALAASNMYEDLIQGDLKRETRNEYYENLLFLGVKASEGFEFYEDDQSEYRSKGSPGSEYVGLAHEMNAMLIISRLRTPSLICTPALPRADSGVHHPAETHDLRALNTKWGEIGGSVGVEVKTTPQQRHFDRYKAILIGGTLHLHPSRLRDPVYLTELLVKDYKKIASEEEVGTINLITGKVVHSLRHGFRNTPQCQEIEDCQEIKD